MPVAVAPDPRNAEEARARILAIRARQHARAQEAAAQAAERDAAQAAAQAQREAEEAARSKAREDFEREQAEARAAAEQEREDVTRDPRRILARVAAAFGVSVRDIDGPSRKVSVLLARFAAIHALREANPHFSLGRIGQCVGGRDHSTVHSALSKMAREGVPQPNGTLLPLAEAAAHHHRTLKAEAEAGDGGRG